MKMGIQTIKKDGFDAAVAKGNAIVEFGAPWCGFCRKLHPVMEKIAGESDFPFYEVNCDEEQELAERFDISTLPTVIFFQDGKAKDQFIGYVPYADFHAFIHKNA